MVRKIFAGLIFVLFTTGFLSAQDIFEFVKNNNYRAVKKFNRVDDFKATPVMWAVYKSDLKMVKLLVKKGADVKQKGWIQFIDSTLMIEFMYGSCMVAAAGENKIDILKYLIKKKDISVNDKEINLYDKIENGWDALHWAAAKGNNEVILYLIKQNVNIDAEAETDFNQTALHFAIRYGKPSTAKLLIDSGADINKKDNYDNSPLMYAMHYKDRATVKYLIKKGARPGIQGVNINDLLKQYFQVENYDDL